MAFSFASYGREGALPIKRLVPCVPLDVKGTLYLFQTMHPPENRFRFQANAQAAGIDSTIPAAFTARVSLGGFKA
jgi:hypothetical protein